MDNRIEILDANKKLLAVKVGKNMPKGLFAHSSEKDYIQIMSWNYDAGKELQAHTHLFAPRNISCTQEAIVVLQGKLKADVYDKDNNKLTDVVVEEGECMFFLFGGHGYKILEDNTR